MGASGAPPPPDLLRRRSASSPWAEPELLRSGPLAGRRRPWTRRPPSLPSFQGTAPGGRPPSRSLAGSFGRAPPAVFQYADHYGKIERLVSMGSTGDMRSRMDAPPGLRTVRPKGGTLPPNGGSSAPERETAAPPRGTFPLSGAIVPPRRRSDPPRARQARSSGGNPSPARDGSAPAPTLRPPVRGKRPRIGADHPDTHNRSLAESGPITNMHIALATAPAR